MGAATNNDTSEFFESVLELDRRVREFAETEADQTTEDVELFRDLLHNELQGLVRRYHR